MLRLRKSSASGARAGTAAPDSRAGTAAADSRAGTAASVHRKKGGSRGGIEMKIPQERHVAAWGIFFRWRE